MTEVYFSEAYNSTSQTFVHVVLGLRNSSISDIESECPDPSQERDSLPLFYAVLSTIFLIGILGNSLIILIFIRHNKVRTAPNTYICNLAVTDLLVTLNCASSPLADAIGRTYPIACKLYQVNMESSMCVTAFTLTALSIERYYAIAKPLHRRISSKKCTLGIVVTVWIVSLAYVCSKMFLLPESKCPGCFQMFNPSTSSKSYTILDFVLFYLMPLAVIADLYILMAFELYSSGRCLTAEGVLDPKALRRLQVRKRIAWTVLALVIMYALFYLPYSIMTLRLHFMSDYRNQQYWSSWTKVLFCIGCLHNSFNPLVLYSLSTTFRGHMNNYLFYNIFSSPRPVDDDNTHTRNSITSKTSSISKSPLGPV